LLDHLETEGRNPASEHLDELTPLELVRLMNEEDARVISAVASQEDTIARAIAVIADRLRAGGRLIYAGAGTSGRLGVLDASECPPTFNTPPEMVVGVIAGGTKALTTAVEGAEDDPHAAERDLAAHQLSAADVLVGIATSGRTPYVLGALAYARRVGAFTIGLSCVSNSELATIAELMIVPIVGPEVLSGSTRLKAGTATKLVLNMLSTGAMVQLGKTFGNLMIDLRATNTKLRARANRIVRQLTGLDEEAADALLQSCGGELKTALVSQLAAVMPDAARQKLVANAGVVRTALPSRNTVDESLVLGIDGGGSHTVALLARDGVILGRGESGPSNLRTVGEARALSALNEAIDRAFTAASIERCTVGSACLGLAGAGSTDVRDRVLQWAQRNHLARHLNVTTDVALLLAHTPENWGLAIVAGTGSIAWGRAPDGREARAGGWGPLLGDDGSGYAIALDALRYIASAHDGNAPPTELTNVILTHLNLSDPCDLVPLVHGGALDRMALAALAPLVIDSDDPLTMMLVKHQAHSLACDACSVVRQLTMYIPIPLVLSGSLLLRSERYRQLLVDSLKSSVSDGLPIASVNLVSEPAEGALTLAMQLLGKSKA
jgi:N-acetylmuramic acid 6-phosphate etherase